MTNKTLDLYRRSGWGVNRLFDELFDLSPTQWRTAMSGLEFIPAMDVEEREDHFLLSMDLPGVKKEDVHVELNDHRLTVSGERKEERVEGNKKNRHVVERTYGKFERSVTLPSNIKFEDIEADFEEGVLKIALPKASASQARTVEIGGKKARKLAG